MSKKQTELFPAESVQMDSPKLAWLKKHGVITYRHPGDEYGFPPCWFVGFQSWWPGETGANFFAQETGHHGDSRCVEASTEEEALATFARYFDIPLWNEEPEQPPATPPAKEQPATMKGNT